MLVRLVCKRFACRGVMCGMKKMALNKFCYDKTREQFVARVKPWIITMNVVMAEAYTFKMQICKFPHHTVSV